MSPVSRLSLLSLGQSNLGCCMSCSREQCALACWSIPTLPPHSPLSRTFRLRPRPSGSKSKSSRPPPAATLIRPLRGLPKNRLMRCWWVAARCSTTVQCKALGWRHTTGCLRAFGGAELAASCRRGLQENGYVEDQNVRIEYRWAEGRHDRLPALAADLVNRCVAVIASTGGPDVVEAAAAATTTVPIVFLGSDVVLKT